MATNPANVQLAKSTVTSSDRMSFTIFIAFALHALLFLGVRFSYPTKAENKPVTLNLTIVSTHTPEKVEDADYLANASQLGGGNTNEAVKAKEKFSVQSQDTNVGTSNQEKLESSTKDTKAGQDHTLAQQKSDFKIIQDTMQNRIKASENVDTTELLKNERELSMLIRDLNDHSLRSTRKKPDSKYLTAHTRKANEAAYFHIVSTKIEAVSRHYYPPDALQNNTKGAVKLLITISPSGVLITTKVLQSSGHSVLDEAAKHAVRLSQPFPRIPKEVLESKDELKIVREILYESRFQ